jgi:arylsulfatase
VHWPKGISAKGELRMQVSHTIDIMATCLDIVKAEYPKQFNGNEIQNYQGKSLVPAFKNVAIKRAFMFWEHAGHRAIRVDDWKLVAKTRKQKTFDDIDEKAWELYDMKNDPSEMNNLITQYPEKAKKLMVLWEQEAIRTKAKPWPWKPAK